MTDSSTKGPSKDDGKAPIQPPAGKNHELLPALPSSLGWQPALKHVGLCGKLLVLWVLVVLSGFSSENVKLENCFFLIVCGCNFFFFSNQSKAVNSLLTAFRRCFSGLYWLALCFSPG